MKKLTDYKIREHFENRKIQPSENAWERMQQRIPADNKKPKKKTLLRYFPYGVAAALCIGLFLFLRQENPNPAIIADGTLSPLERTVIQAPLAKTTTEIASEQAMQTNESELTSINTEKKSSSKPKLFTQKTKKDIVIVEESELVEVEKPVQEIVQSITTPASNQNLLSLNIDELNEVELKQEVEKLLAEAMKLQKDKANHLKRDVDTEVDELLTLAMMQSEINDLSKTLLADVESELDRRSYEKIYYALAEQVMLYRKIMN